MRYSVDLSFEDLLLLCNVLESKHDEVSFSINEGLQLITSDGLPSDHPFVVELADKRHLDSDLLALKDRLSCVMREGGEADE